MKRFPLALILMLLFSLIMVSCGPGPDMTETTPTEPPPTAAATVSAGNTSQQLSLQENNDFITTVFIPKPSSELADNRIGGNAETRHIDSRIWAMGNKWMRVIIDPSGQWQHVDWDADGYTIDSYDEQVIDDLVSNGVEILLVLDVWYPDQRSVYYKTEEDIATYTSWVRFMVRHFKGRIAYYEILNEPDLSFEAPSGMPVDAYVNLVKATVPVIREEDPDAKIVIGATPYTLLDHCRDWMWGVLNSDAMPLVDGFSWHGMYGAAPSDDPRGWSDIGARKMANYWENYPAFVEEIKAVAAANGFEGEFMTEEMIWRTPASDFSPAEVADYTDIAAAKYFARAIIIHLGLDVTPGLATFPDDGMPVSYSIVQALATIMAGAEPAEFPLTIESEAENIKTYAFELPNGDKLQAIWTDGPAVDEDPGMPVTLTFPGFSAQSVTGFDPLHGRIQEIIFENEGGNLIIHDVLVRDYPVIFSITP